MLNYNDAIYQDRKVYMHAASIRSRALFGENTFGYDEAFVKLSLASDVCCSKSIYHCQVVD